MRPRRPGGGPGLGRGELSEEDLDRGAHAFGDLHEGLGAAVEHLDQLVWRVMDGLAGTSRSLLLLAPVKSFSERLFLHSINVATLAVAHGRSLGIEGTTLHAIGLGALLHDVGKLALPERLWNRETPLYDSDRALARLHPELGAALLAGAGAVPPVAVLAAYEHHLRWDGRPSYPAVRRPPNLASRLTAVADAWDGFASASGDLLDPRDAALHLWREQAGGRLDPFLAGSFVLLMSEVSGAAERTGG